MSRAGRVARRVGFAVVAAYLVVTVTFLFVAVPPDPGLQAQLYQMQRHGASDAEIERFARLYRSARNMDEPLADRYARWLVGVATLDWGYSADREAVVTDLVASRLPYTLGYVLPAMALAACGGVLGGLYSATNRGTLLDWLGRDAAYLGLGVPNFWLAQVAVFASGAGLGWLGWLGLGGPPPVEFWSVGTAKLLGAAAVVLTSSLLAGQLRYARAESLEYVGTDFVKLLRAKGASRWRVARHVARNAAIPLVSLFFTEMLGVLVLNVYVIEVVFGIPGIGQLSFQAIQDRDMPVIIGTTMVVVFAGILGNLVQDVAYDYLDPRVGSAA